jgi:hypothetical protein
MGRTDDQVKAKNIIVILSLTLIVGAFGSWRIQQKVLRVSSAKEACIRHLAWIAGTKDLAAKELHLTTGAVLTTQTFSKYTLNGLRDCPAGGTYSINPIGVPPRCSIPGHSLSP